jgi:gamma-glutamyltranspeptidase/glutathione hydrolase
LRQNLGPSRSAFVRRIGKFHSRTSALFFLSVALALRPAVAAVAEHGMVAAEHELASQVGAEVLRSGGNAVDAAIAASLAVCVLNSSSCGIGGGGFMLIYLAEEKKAVALDYRETAPAAATRDMYVRDGKVDSDASRRGGLAVAVPGEIAGLAEVASKYATRPLARLLEPAIRLARDGYPVGKHLAETIAAQRDAIRGSPGLAANFLRRDGTPPVAGEIIRQPELARTLQRVADEGPQAFYRGPIAAEIVRAGRAAGGVLSEADLANYRPIWREPIRFAYRGYDLVAMPPPSSAGVLLEVLAILRDDDLAKLGRHSPVYLHLLAEAMKHAFADRAELYGDPIAADVPLARLLSPANAGALRKTIKPSGVLAQADYGSSPGAVSAPLADHGTSHLSVLDARGNAVACTTTINTAFGSFVVAGDTGIILNNEMDDFATQPGVPNVFGLIGSEANAIAPGRRPLSSMSPTIAVRDDKAVLAAGGSGGPLILSGTLQVLLNSLVFELSAQESVAAARIHHQWVPPVLMLEAGIPEITRKALEKNGHQTRTLASMGAVQLAHRRNGRIEGAADPRKAGGAAGW